MNPETDAAPDVLIALTTVPDEAAAVKLTEALLQQRLAACVHRLPGGVSTYRWQGQIETASEFTLLIKSRRSVWLELEAMIASLHPYETPEIIGLPVEAIVAPYLKWIVDETKP
ncbi:MAG: divalent-cation tolerance protein CutA [Betaproteobacteria bacterium]|nr:divalent-cation tolerance protein CutA [Betaproteobacteria bacterium]